MSEIIRRFKTKATDKEGDRVRFSLIWAWARRADLVLTTDALICGDWRIPYTEIDEAVVVAVGLVPGGRVGHLLRVRHRGRTYQFQSKPDSYWRGSLLPLGSAASRSPFGWRRA
jgi:hypothetical protein